MCFSTARILTFIFQPHLEQFVCIFQVKTEEISLSHYPLSMPYPLPESASPVNGGGPEYRFSAISAPVLHYSISGDHTIATPSIQGRPVITREFAATGRA